jgi:hypothetical protein
LYSGRRLPEEQEEYVRYDIATYPSDYTLSGIQERSTAVGVKVCGGNGRCRCDVCGGSGEVEPSNSN